MSENSLTQSSSSPTLKNRGWLHVFWIGAVLFVVTAITMFLTGNIARRYIDRPSRLLR